MSGRGPDTPGYAEPPVDIDRNKNAGAVGKMTLTGR